RQLPQPAGSPSRKDSEPRGQGSDADGPSDRIRSARALRPRSTSTNCRRSARSSSPTDFRAFGSTAAGSGPGEATSSSVDAQTPKSDAREPARPPTTATPVNMIAPPDTRPAVVFGTISPYPTVVSVTVPHHNASPKVANPGLAGCSASYALSE